MSIVKIFCLADRGYDLKKRMGAPHGEPTYLCYRTPSATEPYKQINYGKYDINAALCSVYFATYAD